jgi:hypothetical protein
MLLLSRSALQIRMAGLVRTDESHESITVCATATAASVGEQTPRFGPPNNAMACYLGGRAAL